MAGDSRVGGASKDVHGTRYVFFFAVVCPAVLDATTTAVVHAYGIVLQVLLLALLIRGRRQMASLLLAVLCLQVFGGGTGAGLPSGRFWTKQDQQRPSVLARCIEPSHKTSISRFIRFDVSV